MQIQENIILAPYTTFKIGGPAEYFALVKTLEELQEAIAWAKENAKDIFVFGGGSNLLISDNGIKGLVIKLDLQRLEFDENKVIVGAGLSLAYLLNQALENALTGLEFAAGVPGTVGGAIRGNAGTYGLAMGDVVTAIRYLDKNNELKTMAKNEADFAYRHSIFKVNNYLIVEAELLLAKGDVAASKALVQERLMYRKNNHPNQPSAGCIFKNISFKEADIESLKAKSIEVEKFLEHKKIPAGYLIEKAGLKAKTIGQAQVSTQHANYIINLGGAKAEEVMILTSLIKQQIRDKFGLQLEEEVQFVG
ncbi:MAG: UDP-N-acetylenolpyruvoylglucosamine reductase [Parcubacteria group bacterium GW2011_GWA2_36_10]|nr:MAG: UDP-N-acetylenolpyruvoylglucosamine reductase [Parcubacteria group bacterium GW2011_GWA2_36_10]